MAFRGERLKEAREKKQLRQRDLAHLSGINEIQLSRYENDKSEPSATSLEALARNLDISADYLLGLADDPHKRYGEKELTADQRAVLETLERDGWRGLAYFS